MNVLAMIKGTSHAAEGVAVPVVRGEGGREVAVGRGPARADRTIRLVQVRFKHCA